MLNIEQCMDKGFLVWSQFCAPECLVAYLWKNSMMYWWISHMLVFLFAGKLSMQIVIWTDKTYMKHVVFVKWSMFYNRNYVLEWRLKSLLISIAYSWSHLIHIVYYRIAGNFRGGLIFVVFVVFFKPQKVNPRTFATSLVMSHPY